KPFSCIRNSFTFFRPLRRYGKRVKALGILKDGKDKGFRQKYKLLLADYYEREKEGFGWQSSLCEACDGGLARDRLLFQ
ncbi:MAG: hypothetical protein ABIR18_10025, partial [Chitinophagaceae bacterium]